MSTILIVSHSPYSSTGYGRVVRGLAGSLQSANHKIVCLGIGSRPVGPKLPYPVFQWKGISPQAIAESIRRHQPDVLLTIGDPWMFELLPGMPEQRDTVWMAYYPVDGYPFPNSWKKWAATVDVPVVFSKFARDVVETAIGTPPALIYHGVNTRTFSANDRFKSKQLANVEGHFVVGTVARNQMRKNIPALVKAFAKFARGKDDALLYLHTQLKGEFDIAELVENAGIEEKTRITGELGPDKGVADHLLATVYQAMDVFVLPTMAEGFGLPIMEAQACGTPALVTDFSACPELVPDPIQRLKVKEMLTMARNLEQAIVDVDDIVEKLEVLYSNRPRLEELGKRCHRFAQAFDWQAVYRQFNELIASERFQSVLAAKKLKQGKAATGVSMPAGPFSQTPIGSINGQVKDNGGVASKGAAAEENKLSRFEEISQLHAQAIANMKAGKANEAVPQLRRVVELQPANPDFLNELAVALQMSGDGQGAIASLRRSLKLRPNHHQVWTNLGQALLTAGELSEAREACDHALKLSPNAASAHDLFGAILLKEDRPTEARRQFQRALELQPDLVTASTHLKQMGPLAEWHDGPVATTPARSGLTADNAMGKLDEAVRNLQPCPGGFERRGVVILGGGIRYFPCAWVCIRMLREHGCQLPIELWHLGYDEMSASMRELVAPFGVTCVDGQALSIEAGLAELGGWELKPFAIQHSRFKEVLALDADNFPVSNPEHLFDCEPYRQHGAVFWPDYHPIKPANRIWGLTGVRYQEEPSFESGQILINKGRCWEALSLTMWMNHTSDFWYRYLLGDKDTFHLAWRKLEQPYAMPKGKPTHLQYGMAHDDFAGRRVFQHRNRAKWVLSGWNPKTDDFEQEERGFQHLDELRRVWHPQMVEYDHSATKDLQAAWQDYKLKPGAGNHGLSVRIIDATAWQLIGRVAEHCAEYIDDAHTVNLIKKAIEVAPHVAELHEIYGTTLGAMGRHHVAAAAFERAAELDPKIESRTGNLKRSRLVSHGACDGESISENRPIASDH